MSVSTVLTNPESSHEDNHEPEEGEDYDNNHKWKRIEDPKEVMEWVQPGPRCGQTVLPFFKVPETSNVEEKGGGVP